MQFLADLIVLAHFAYVTFVVLGLAAIWLGLACGGGGCGISGSASSTF